MRTILSIAFMLLSAVSMARSSTLVGDPLFGMKNSGTGPDVPFDIKFE